MQLLNESTMSSTRANLSLIPVSKSPPVSLSLLIPKCEEIFVCSDWDGNASGKKKKTAEEDEDYERCKVK